MISLPKYLCNLLKCDTDELPSLIRANPFRISKLLTGVALYYSSPPLPTLETSTAEQQPLTPVRVDGVTKAGVATLFACGGHLGITVEQAYYLRYGRTFRHPQLQCIVQRQGEFGGELYIPIEVVKVDQKK